MARFVYGMMQSLDGYIDGPTGSLQLGPPDPTVFRHFVKHVRNLSGILYGRRMYDLMRYWDEEHSEWGADEHDFAGAWRAKPKWVASHSAPALGPNATLVQGSLIDFVRKLKTEREGEIDVAGTELASQLSAAALIDEYHLYLRPQVLGGGKPYFLGHAPPLRLLDLRRVGEDVAQLTYVRVRGENKVDP